MRRLHYTLRGIHLAQGNSFARPRRSPITIRHLYQLIRFVSGSSLGPNDCALFTAVTLIAFFGLLRVSENTCLSQTFDLTSHLSVQDVTLTRQVVHLHIKASKTNPFRAGVTVWVPAISSALCLVSAIYLYLRGSIVSVSRWSECYGCYTKDLVATGSTHIALE